MLVFGTRPEAIKMAPLVKEFEKYTKRLKIDAEFIADAVDIKPLCNSIDAEDQVV